MSRPPVDPQTLTKTRSKLRVTGSFRNGKPRTNITMPMYLHEAIKKEALSLGQSFNYTAVNWLEAAYALANEED